MLGNIGQEIENIKVRLSTKCHANFQYVCVTPLAYDKHHNWNLTKNHLLGVWKDNNITHDMAQLKTQISAMSKAHDGFTDLEGLAQSISSSLRPLNPVSWLH